jgi:hypothetical protein
MFKTCYDTFTSWLRINYETCFVTVLTHSFNPEAEKAKIKADYNAFLVKRYEFFNYRSKEIYFNNLCFDSFLALI